VPVPPSFSKIYTSASYTVNTSNKIAGLFIFAISNPPIMAYPENIWMYLYRVQLLDAPVLKIKIDFKAIREPILKRRT